MDLLKNDYFSVKIPCDVKKSYAGKLAKPLVKNLNKFFTFEVEILDDKNFLRRFKTSNYTSKTSVK